MGEKPLTDLGADPDAYCRAIETYLCRRNNGQLIRIVGPAFDLVRGWAESAIPLSVVFRGIDHRIERLESADRRNRRRRPVRIEFCEDDVLEVFGEWRRAVGVGIDRGSANAPSTGAESKDAQPRESLTAHLRRALARLGPLREASGTTAADQEFLDALVCELEGILVGARSLRGERRSAALDRLIELDRELGEWVKRRSPPDVLTEVGADADRELAPFRDRMPEEAYTRSVEACRIRLLRERSGIPRLVLD